MNIYISLPITGHSIDDVEARIISASSVIESRGHQAISPLDIADPDSSYGLMLGSDIASIIDDADAIVLLSGWERSRGCRAEKAVAETFGKGIYLGVESIPVDECFACSRKQCPGRKPQSHH